MMLKPFFDSFWGSITQLAIGCALMVMGLLVWPDQVRRSTPTKSEEAISPSGSGEGPVTNPNREGKSFSDSTYRLRYNTEKGHWTLKPLGKSTAVLTDIIPGPRETRVPGGYLSKADIAGVLLSVLRDWKFTLNEEEINRLRQIEVDGIPLFAQGDFVTGGERDAVDLPVKPADLTALKNWPLPAMWNPTSESFSSSMGIWREKVLPLVRAATSTASSFNLNLLEPGEPPVRVMLTQQARRRIIASDFGMQTRDAAIYLQFLLVKQGADLKVDGQFGKGSRSQLHRYLNSESSLRDTQEKFFRHYFGNAIPPMLVPGTSDFYHEMKAWRQEVLGKAGSGLPPGVRSKVSSPSFGNRKQDEALYLQILANRYGQAVSVDGRFGAQSRGAMVKILSQRFRRPSQAAEYQRILKKRFP